VPLLRTHELTTALTTTMTTVGLHDTSTYTTMDLYRAWSSYRPVTTDRATNCGDVAVGHALCDQVDDPQLGVGEAVPPRLCPRADGATLHT
jgi:hypothetical protein